MLIALALVLFLAWIFAVVIHVASAAIHVLVLAAVVSAVAHFIRPKTTT